MAESAKVSLKLSAADGESDKRAPLADFANICSALRNCLKHISRCLGHDKSDFVISDLRFGSAVVEAEPRTSAGREEGQLFNATMAAIEEGREVDPRLDYSAICCFTGFSGAIRNPRLRLALQDRNLTSHYIANLSSLLEPSSPALGSVSGRLEVVNIHKENKFVLYPPIAGEEVTCRFNDADLESILKAVNHQVTVFGTLHYAKSKAFPVRVDVDEFEVEPPDDQLSSLLDTRGIIRSAGELDQPLGGEWCSGWQ